MNHRLMMGLLALALAHEDVFVDNGPVFLGPVTPPPPPDNRVRRKPDEIIAAARAKRRKKKRVA